MAERQREVVFGPGDRNELFEEFHRRPPVPMDRFDRCSHLTIRCDPADREGPPRALARLCAALGVEAPPPDSRQHLIELDDIALKWELHGEFFGLTIYAGPPPDPERFADEPATAALGARIGRDGPADNGLPEGERLAAAHLFVRRHRGAFPSDLGALAREDVFPTGRIAAGLVCDGNAVIWTDLALAEDGFSRIVIDERGLGGRRCGRLVQRLIEAETYRIAAMLGLPVAHASNGFAKQLEDELHEILENRSAVAKQAPDREELDRLLALASDVEHFLVQIGYRMGATKAYAKLVEMRLAELDEQRIPGRQRYAVYVNRRFRPAMETCNAAHDRVRELALRIERDAALIRTRIDVARQQQNNDLLHALNRRVELQFKLQRTVEALSTFAISYYAIGIVDVFSKLIAGELAFVRSSLLTGIAAPIVIWAVWRSLRKAREVSLSSE